MAMQVRVRARVRVRVRVNPACKAFSWLDGSAG